MKRSIMPIRVLLDFGDGFVTEAEVTGLSAMYEPANRATRFEATLYVDDRAFMNAKPSAPKDKALGLLLSTTLPAAAFDSTIMPEPATVYSDAPYEYDPDEPVVSFAVPAKRFRSLDL